MATTMAQFMILGYLANVAYGLAAPAPTPPPELEKRQIEGLESVWSPSIDGSTVTYLEYPSGRPRMIVTSGQYYQWCPRGIFCDIITSCSSGTLFFHGSSATYDPDYPICGVEYLYSTLGASNRLTRPAGFFATDTTFEATFFAVSPTPTGQSSTSDTTSTPTSTSPTSDPTHPPTVPSHPAPVGAIVGGVVGGLAVLSVAILGFLFLRHTQRRERAVPGGGMFGAHTAPPIYPGSPPPFSSQSSPYDAKYASVTSNFPYAPSSPSPMAQSEAFSAGQKQSQAPEPHGQELRGLGVVQHRRPEELPEMSG